MGNAREILRKEAAAVSFLELTESQRIAVDKLSEFLQEALELSNKEPSEDRRSRVVLVSGGKGCGKTSLVHTLRELMETKEVFEKLAGKGSNQNIEKAKGSKKLESFVARRNRLQSRFGHDLHKNDRKVTWLDPLYLDPMPAGTNLTAAVLARIHKHASREEQSARPSGLLDPITHVDRAKHELESLQNSAVTSLEGNLDQRAQALDADGFAVNAMDAERQKLEVAKKLNDILGSLAAGVAGNPTKTKGLFVLPVDDMDVRPSRAVQMLQLATMLSIPRLFFLFLGESDAIDQVLFYQTQGEYIRVLGDALASRKEIADSIEAKSNEIASSLLRKFLPPAQRLKLDPMSLGEALLYPKGLKQLAPDGDEKDERPVLNTLLENLPLPLFMAGRYTDQGAEKANDESRGALLKDDCSLRDLLAPPPIIERSKTGDDQPHLSSVHDSGRPANTEAERAEEERLAATVELVDAASPYDGAGLLAGPPRQVADLWSELRELTTGGMDEKAAAVDEFWRMVNRRDPSTGERLMQLISEEKKVKKPVEAADILRIFVQSLTSIVDEDPNPGIAVQRALKAASTRPEDTSSRHWELSPPDIRVVSTLGDKIDLTFDRADRVPSRVVGQEVMVHELRARNPQAPPEEKDPFRPLGPRTRVAYKVTHDLMRMTGQGIVTRNYVHHNRGEMACSIWDDGLSEPLVIPWSSLDWPTFWHQDAYTAIWNEGMAVARRISNKKADLQGPDVALLMLLYRVAAALETICIRPGQKTALPGALGVAGGRGPAQGKWRFADLGANEAIARLASGLDAARRRVVVRRSEGEDDAEADRIDDALLDLALLATPEVLLSIPQTRQRASAQDTKKQEETQKQQEETQEQQEETQKEREEVHRSLREAICSHADKLFASENGGRPDLIPRFRRLRLERIGAHVGTKLGLAFLLPDKVVSEQGAIAKLARETLNHVETHPHLKFEPDQVAAFFERQHRVRFPRRARRQAWEDTGKLLKPASPPRPAQDG